MKSLLLLPVFVIFTVLSVAAQIPADTFNGKLEPQLAPDMIHVYQFVYSEVKDPAKFHFEKAVEKGSVISAGELIDQGALGGKSTMLLVEPAKGTPYVWVDSNMNGIYEQSERHFFDAPVKGSVGLQTVIRLPIKNSFFADFPIFLQYVQGFHPPKLAPTDRVIAQSVYALAYGKVKIVDRVVLFQYPFDVASPAISTTEGLFGVDVDGNGTIRDEQFSVETSYSANGETVFPLGGLFVSTSKIDMTTGAVTVRKRSGSDYHRVDLVVGSTMPDFSFKDLDDKPHTLAEFRGKYLMVDFWGVWCHDCTRETPFHLAAYERFHKRNFEILGLDSDDKVETAKAYIAKNNMPWPQATKASTKDLTEITYRIQEFPSTILLDPNGKVVVIDQHLLQGEELLKTLDRILPKE